MADRKRQNADSVSERPLWLIGLMFALHIAWMAFCALWIPTTFGLAITERLGSPVFILPAIVFTYALAPLGASFSELGREYWDLLGRGGTARRAASKILIFGALCLLLAVGTRGLIGEPNPRAMTRAKNSVDLKDGGSEESHRSR